MKKLYIRPQAETIVFEAKDVITTSGLGTDNFLGGSSGLSNSTDPNDWVDSWK